MVGTPAQPRDRHRARQPESGPAPGIRARQAHGAPSGRHRPDEPVRRCQNLTGPHGHVATPRFEREEPSHPDLRHGAERRSLGDGEAEEATRGLWQVRDHAGIEARRSGRLQGEQAVHLGAVRPVIGGAPKEHPAPGGERQAGKAGEGGSHARPPFAVSLPCAGGAGSRLTAVNRRIAGSKRAAASMRPTHRLTGTVVRRRR